MLKVKSTINVGFFGRLKAAMTAQRLRGPAFDDMRRQWASRYAAFTRRRFVVFARGGGNWRALSESTIRARLNKARNKRIVGRSKKKKTERQLALARFIESATDTRSVKTGGRVEILRDTGILLGALAIGTPGNKVTNLRNGVRYGFSQAPHGDGAMTIGRLAALHHGGGKKPGRPPARPILVQPDDQTKRGMAADLKRATLATARGRA